MTRRHDDEADLVLAARGGDGDAFTTLFRRWFDPCCDVARRIVHDEHTAAEVAQETFLAAWTGLDSLRDPGAFGGWVLRTSRNKALNRLERERRSRPVDHGEPELANLRTGDDTEGDVVSGLSDAEHRSLLEGAAAVLGEREMSVLDLHLRHGMTAPELAEELGVTPNNAHQLLFRMRSRLGAGVRAWVLFAGGRPDCRALAAALASAGVDTFGRTALKVVDRHVGDCEECERRQAAVLAPGALFASAPVVGLAPALRESVADALRDAGVPLGADATVPPDPGPGTDEPVPPHGDGPAAPAVAGVAGSLDDDAATGDRRRAAARLAAIAAVVAALVLVALLLWDTGSDPGEDVAAVEEGSTTTTTTGPTTTATGDPRSGAPTSAPPGTPAPPDPGETTTTPDTAPAEAPPATSAPSVATPPASAPPPPPAPTTTAAPPAPPPAAPTPPPAPPPPAPTVDAFKVAPGSGTCPRGFPTLLGWATTGATSVTIEVTAPGYQLVAPLSGLPADGTTTGCVNLLDPVPAGGWKLSATGPGGTAVRTGP